MIEFRMAYILYASKQRILPKAVMRWTVSVNDQATPRFRLIRGGLTDLNSSHAEPTVSVRDHASNQLDEIRRHVTDVDSEHAEPTVFY